MSDTPITDLLEDMRAAGSTLDAAIPAVRVLEMSRTLSAPVPDKEAIIREYERDKKANQRANTKAKKGGAKANDVARNSTNVPDKVPDSRIASCDLSSSLKKETTEGRKKEVVARARGTRIAPDTELPEADRQFARVEGMSDGAIDRAWAEFLDYWTAIPGQRGTKLNWSSTWRNRVRAISPKGKQHEKPGNVVTAIADLRQRLRQFDEPAPGGLRSGEGAGPVRKLSQG